MKRGEVALLTPGSSKARNLLSNHRALSDAPVILHGRERQALTRSQPKATGDLLHYYESQDRQSI